MNDTIRVTRKGPVTEVELHRPDVHNAFNESMIAALREAFVGFATATQRPRVVVLRAAGRSFSAGADLDWMRRVADYGFEENVADAFALADMLSAIRDCPVPVIARVQGAAMGGGAGLVAACDMAVAADRARFAFSEVRLGLVPAVISPFVLPRIGVSAARELFLTGERFDAARAHQIGLVSRVVAEEELEAVVAERVAALLEGGPDAQAAVKQLIPEVADRGDASRDYTARLIAARRASDEGRAGISAFFARERAPWAPTGSDQP
jgi:methylglutaconyl-CoA hydratase